MFYGGARLRHLGGDVVTVTVPASRAAAIYLFNVERWLQSRPAGVDGEDLTRLQAGLRELAVSKLPGSVSWLVRQLQMWSVRDAPHHERDAVPQEPDPRDVRESPHVDGDQM